MAQVVQVKTEVVPQIKIEIKTEVVEPDYPNYMESIETVINASKEVMKLKTEPKPYTQATVSNQLPLHDHQYSCITFYGSGETNATETKARETPIEEEKKPIQPKVIVRKRLNGNAQIVKMPRQPRQPRQLQQKSHQVIRPQPIIYRFKPNNGLQQLTPAYFMSNIANTSSTHTVGQHTPAIIRSIHRPMPSIYTNATVPLHFKTPVTIVPAIQQPIYYLRVCNPQE